MFAALQQVNLNKTTVLNTNCTMITVKRIAVSQTYEVRQPVLRQGKPIESCFFEGDDLPTTFHYGLFENEKIQGVISVYENENLLFEEKDQIQIRGMAVLEKNQRKGFGQQLVAHCEMEMMSQNKKLIWFNARVTAVGFYEKMGYSIIGNSFDIKDVGLHFVMYKKLRN